MLLKSYGILFEEGNKTALIEVLKDVLTNPTKIESVKSPASKYAHTYLSIQTQADQIKDIINQLTNVK